MRPACFYIPFRVLYVDRTLTLSQYLHGCLASIYWLTLRLCYLAQQCNSRQLLLTQSLQLRKTQRFHTNHFWICLHQWTNWHRRICSRSQVSLSATGSYCQFQTQFAGRSLLHVLISLISPSLQSSSFDSCFLLGTLYWGTIALVNYNASNTNITFVMYISPVNKCMVNTK